VTPTRTRARIGLRTGRRQPACASAPAVAVVDVPLARLEQRSAARRGSGCPREQHGSRCARTADTTCSTPHRTSTARAASTGPTGSTSFARRGRRASSAASP
jgi:hypothetical protein